MNSFLLVILSLIGYIAAYRLYGRYIARKLFNLTNANKMPSHEMKDGIDYVPTKKNIVFGHHFTTIAGLGPIVGPAIGIIWGWLPAFIWVFVGSIFMGAVHDFSILVISARNKGKSIGDLTGNIISRSNRYAFQILIQFLLLIVLSVFTIIMATLFVMYPESVIPVWLQIPIAVWLGFMIRKGKSDILFSIIAVLLLYGTILIGARFPIHIFPILGSEQLTWCIILFIYVYFASTIPVHKLLQPRDYINSHQLTIAILLLVVGIAVAHPVISAPEINASAFKAGTDIPGLMPLLFITIACGAISGFHSLASSGTTVKQVNKEKDTLFIGFGSMLLEGFLAVVVLMAIAGGLSYGIKKGDITYFGIDAFNVQYTSWSGINAGMGVKLEAFVVGASNILDKISIPFHIASTLIAVFIVSFANTTLDSATRIQRLSFQELIVKKDNEKSFLSNRYISTLIVVVSALLLTFHELRAKSGLELWRLFGAMNQLLAALGLIVVSVYLYLKKKNYLYAFIPMLFILAVTVWAMIDNLIDFIKGNYVLLTVIAFLILIVTLWMLISGIKSVLIKIKKPINFN